MHGLLLPGHHCRFRVDLHGGEQKTVNNTSL
jgi:hypothetical protein